MLCLTSVTNLFRDYLFLKKEIEDLKYYDVLIQLLNLNKAPFNIDYIYICNEYIHNLYTMAV